MSESMNERIALLGRFRSHKVVHAGKITAITDRLLGVEAADGTTIEIAVPENFFGRGIPSPGDQLIAYDNADGTYYLSWSPARAFEDGYASEAAEAHAGG